VKTHTTKEEQMPTETAIDMETLALGFQDWSPMDLTTTGEEPSESLALRLASL
jgi:hypothetical protein